MADIAIDVRGIGKWYVVNENRFRGALVEKLARLIFKPPRTPRAIYVLKRGDINKPEDPATRSSLGHRRHRSSLGASTRPGFD